MSAWDTSATGGSFAFSAENAAEADKIIAKYPAGRQQSASIPLLQLAQAQNGGWLPPAAVERIADMLDLPSIRVWEVATFYGMFHHQPVGRHRVYVCTTTPCWLRGSDAVTAACEKALGVAGFNQTSADGLFTLMEVECQGACVNAPMMVIDETFYEDLDAASTTAILETIRRGETPKQGPQVKRQNSAPAGGRSTLTVEPVPPPKAPPPSPPAPTPTPAAKGA